jgi:hypothetical protein
VTSRLGTGKRPTLFYSVAEPLNILHSIHPSGSFIGPALWPGHCLVLPSSCNTAGLSLNAYMRGGVPARPVFCRGGLLCSFVGGWRWKEGGGGRGRFSRVFEGVLCIFWVLRVHGSRYICGIICNHSVTNVTIFAQV